MTTMAGCRIARMLKGARKALEPLVRGDSVEEWPVIHISLHANTFPLAYVYSNLLLRKTWPPAVSIGASRSGVLESKIRTEEWSNEPPKLESSARLNIFFANPTQVRQWRAREHFLAFKLFSFRHQFVLAANKNAEPSSGDLDLVTWVGKLAPTIEEIRIVTDINAEADTLVDEIRVALSQNRAIIQFPRLSVTPAGQRTQHDVLRWDFLNENKRVERLFFFGSPYSEILAADKSKYVKIKYEESTDTYVCFWTPDPMAAYFPVINIYDFFKKLGYKTVDRENSASGRKAGKQVETPLQDVADAFRRCTEARLPGVSMEETRFRDGFVKSVYDHSFLVKEADLLKPLRPR